MLRECYEIGDEFIEIYLENDLDDEIIKETFDSFEQKVLKID